MQLQMETCNLNECDFLETRFKEYETESEFHQDGSFRVTAAGQPKGVIMYFMVEGRPHYEYAPLALDPDAFGEWERHMMQQHVSHTWVKNIYWRLDQLSCVLVLRNKVWFTAALPVMRETWNMITKGRAEGYEQYAPRSAKRARETSNTICDVVPKPRAGMLIDTSTVEAPSKDNYIEMLLSGLQSEAP